MTEKERIAFLNLQARVVILEEKLGKLILDCPGCEKVKRGDNKS